MLGLNYIAPLFPSYRLSAVIYIAKLWRIIIGLDRPNVNVNNEARRIGLRDETIYAVWHRRPVTVCAVVYVLCVSVSLPACCAVW